jgi:hypothetical protein
LCSAERRVEFGDQVSRELQNGERNDEINQDPLVDGRDCAGQEHDRESEVYRNSPWARLADHRNENSHKHQKCEEEAQMSILTPESRELPFYISHGIFSFRIRLADFIRGSLVPLPMRNGA